MPKAALKNNLRPFYVMALELGTFTPNTLMDAVERAEKCTVSAGLVALGMSRLCSFGPTQIKQGSLEITLSAQGKRELCAEIERIDNSFLAWEMFL